MTLALMGETVLQVPARGIQLLTDSVEVHISVAKFFLMAGCTRDNLTI